MNTSSQTLKTRDEALRSLALEAVRRRLRPLADRDGSLANRLFALQDRIQDRRRAVHLLRSSFQATDPGTVSAADAKIYERELARRQRERARLEQERAGLLCGYAELLLASRPPHPALKPHFDELDRRG